LIRRRELFLRSASQSHIIITLTARLRKNLKLKKRTVLLTRKDSKQSFIAEVPSMLKNRYTYLHEADLSRENISRVYNKLLEEA
jgi:hypothetical protein